MEKLKLGNDNDYHLWFRGYHAANEVTFGRKQRFGSRVGWSANNVYVL